MLVHLSLPAGEVPPEFSCGADALWLTGGAAEIASYLRAAQREAGGPQLYACVGAPGAALDDDLDQIMPAAPDGIILPAMRGADVQHLGVKLAVREAECGREDGTTRIIARVLSPEAIFHLGSFAKASPRLVALAFDTCAFAEALHTEATALRQDSPLALARNLTLLAARAAGVPALLRAGPTENLSAGACDGFDGMIVTDAAAVAEVRGVGDAICEIRRQNP